MKAKQEGLQICINPSCGKQYKASHYGRLQKVCSGTYQETCKKCPGKKCQRCAGKGAYKEQCSHWYKIFWSQTRKIPRGMPDRERKRALGHAFKEDIRFWALLVAAASSALRKGELLGLTWSDVDDVEGIRSNFVLRGQWDDKKKGFKATKTGSGRVAYFFKEVRDAVNKVRTGIAKDEGPDDRVWPYSEANTWARWIKLQRELKILHPDTRRPFKFHDLRHTSALRSLERTGRLSDASTLCGHKTPAVTAIYTMERPENFVSRIEDGKKSG